MDTDNQKSTELTISDVELPPITDLFYEFIIKGISGWDDLRHIGRNNIQKLIVHLRDKERSLTVQIHQVRTEQEILRGKTGEDIREKASEHTCPSNIKMGVRDDSWTQDLEPIDADSINRTSGTTTFNLCGWCKYSILGTGRYSYGITPKCGLLRFSPPEVNTEGLANTPCKLHAMNVDQFDEIVESMEAEVTMLKERRVIVQAAIKKLQELQNGQTDKPYLVSLRPNDQFNLGDRVMLFIDCQKNKLCVDGHWAPAKVIMGFRYQEGCISTCADFPIWKQSKYLNGAGSGYGNSRPECLLMSTFTYLRKEIEGDDRRFVEIWLDNIGDRLEGFDRNQFAHGLTDGTIAVSEEVTVRDVPEVKTLEDARGALQMLSFPKTLEQLNSSHRFIIGQVHPDRFSGCSDEVRAYLNRETAAVNTARDLLIEKLKLK